MLVLGTDILDAAQQKHSTLAKPIAAWIKLVENCKARNPVDLKKTFSAVDTVPPQTVFNLKGNNFRIIAEIDYDTETVTVTHVLNHKEYDKNKWKRK
jgi:mRNA interferase HigB